MEFGGVVGDGLLQQLPYLRLMLILYMSFFIMDHHHEATVRLTPI